MAIWYKREFELVPVTTTAQRISTAWALNDGQWSLLCMIGGIVAETVSGLESEDACKLAASKWVAAMAAKIEQGGGGIVIIDDSDFRA